MNNLAFKKSVEEFNRFRSPEASVKLVKIEGNSITVSFSGPFCVSCGIYDYFEDFIYVLEDHGINAEIVDIKAKGDAFEVKLNIKRL